MEGHSKLEAARTRAAVNLPAAIAIVVPTFNERENAPLLVERIDAAMAGLAWEVVFVDDDSKDGTLPALSTLASDDPRVRYLHRIGRRGLSSAVVEGVLSTNAPLVAVMDADLQHDPALLPKMAALFSDPALDLVVGSRYAKGGGVGAWNNERQQMSRFATKLSRLVVKADLSDPMSGFFMIRREAFNAAARNLSGQGYKILLDVIASSPKPLKIEELPFVFGVREHGESKLDSLVLWEYLALLLDKTVGKYVPARFVMFSIVGGAGVVVHMGVLITIYRLLHLVPFDAAQLIAAIVAMTFNFFVNNLLTYRDRRLKGWGALRGLLSFYAVGAIGIVANVGIAHQLHEQHFAWELAAIAGIVVGAVWNYAASAIFTWRNK